MKNDTRVNATRMPIASVQLSGAVKADQGCRSIPFLTVLRLRGIRHSGQWISIRTPALDLEAAAGMDSVLRQARVRVPPPSPGGEEERQNGFNEGYLYCTEFFQPVATHGHEPSLGKSTE